MSLPLNQYRLYKKYLLLASIFFYGTSSLMSCSVYEKKFYSEPIEHAVYPQNKINDNINPKLKSFENAVGPSFIDTIGKTIIQIRLNNDYSLGMIGPIFIPMIPVYSGYGHPSTQKSIKQFEDDRIVMVDLMIEADKDDTINFTPALFRIQKKEGTSSTLIKINESEEIHQTVQCTGKQSFRLTFKPGVKVNTLPVLFLESLKMNGHPVYTNGIAFKVSKKSFYSPIVAANR